MALQKREAFAEITIKATENGTVGEMKTFIEIYDDVTGVVETSTAHRQVVPLDNTAKMVQTPTGMKSVADIIGPINADIAVANSTLAAEKAALAAEKETLVSEKASLSAENQSLKGGKPNNQQ